LEFSFLAEKIDYLGYPEFTGLPSAELHPFLSIASLWNFELFDSDPKEPCLCTLAGFLSEENEDLLEGL